jgi:hypothetical protein
VIPASADLVWHFPIAWDVPSSAGIGKKTEKSAREMIAAQTSLMIFIFRFLIFLEDLFFSLAVLCGEWLLPPREVSTFFDSCRLARIDAPYFVDTPWRPRAERGFCTGSARRT